MPYEKIDADLIEDVASSVLFRTRKPSAFGAADGADGTDPLRNTDEIIGAIKFIDANVFGVIRSTPNHPLRRLLFTKVTLTDGQVLTDLPVGSVIIDDKPGKQVDNATVDRYKANVLQLTTALRYWCWNRDGDKGSFHFTGSVAEAVVVPEVGTDYPATPKECQGTVFFGVMAAVLPKEGKFVEAQANYASLYNRGLELIKLGAEGPAMPGKLEIQGFGG